MKEESLSTTQILQAKQAGNTESRTLNNVQCRKVSYTPWYNYHQRQADKNEVTVKVSRNTEWKSGE